jgi:hypothetical protein
MKCQKEGKARPAGAFCSGRHHPWRVEASLSGAKVPCSQLDQAEAIFVPPKKCRPLNAVMAIFPRNLAIRRHFATTYSLKSRAAVPRNRARLSGGILRDDGGAVQNPKDRNRAMVNHHSMRRIRVGVSKSFVKIPEGFIAIVVGIIKISQHSQRRWARSRHGSRLEQQPP